MIDFRTHKRETRPSDIDYIQIRLASPDEIRELSYGEVQKPETINYRSFKPEKDGLFCEKIFGPVKDWECHCGKYKRIRFRGVVCDRCGVEVIQSKVRRERMGHIELAVPIAHIWFFKTLPSRIGSLLDMTMKDLERVIYYAHYIVIDPGDTEYKKRQLISIDEYQEVMERNPKGFVAKIGAEAIRDLLQEIDIDDMSRELRAHVKVETSIHRKKHLQKRLRVVEAFRQSANRPEWMIMEAVPVLPPDLRPLVPLEGGRFATSDLNDLYRRVINRNNRLKKLIEMRAPEVILRNEKRMLQEAVDALFDNGRRAKAVLGRGKRPLKSLSDMLKGKQGRFRQNLLGKRVDYSGRSVIVVGPELKLHQCGLPKIMALELFKPFIIRKLEEKGYVQTVKSAKKLVEKERPEVWDILEEIIKDHPIFLNRAPTLHRLGLQAFEPVLVEGKAIRIHPLVCAAFNADFDGDQMAVHIPLSFEAQLEARILMMSTNNILLPANGRPVTSPTQDMILGCYYLTKERPGDEGKDAPLFGNADEVLLAYENKVLTLHSPVRVKWSGKVIRTTVGRVIFNLCVPEGLDFVNTEIKKSSLEKVIYDAYRNPKCGPVRTVQFLDDLKELGFTYATKGGITIAIDDMIIPKKKKEFLDKTWKEIEKIQTHYRNQVITDGERYNKVIDTWTHTSTDVAQEMFERLQESHGGFNPIWMMVDSGSRGSREQIRQLAGMRGLMAKPQKKITGQIGEIIESPITSNFREGLTVLEYFISTHGARKGLADTALKTADAGYLTRRLVDVAQDVTISEPDCGTIRGFETGALKEGEEIIEPLRDRVVGTVANEDIVDPITNETIVESGQEIDEEKATAIEESGIETVNIRSVLRCEAQRGICQKCYGWSMATMKRIDIGEAVGIIAAQSIGEPGTQLTLRTFHIGGTAARIAVQTRKYSKFDGSIQFKEIAFVHNKNGQRIVTSRDKEVILKDEKGRKRGTMIVPHGATLMVEDKQPIKAGDLLFEWDPYSTPILTDEAGKVIYKDIEEEITLREELDENTGHRQRVITEDREKKLHPRIAIQSPKRKKPREFSIPAGAHLLVRDGEKVSEGEILAKVPREIYKTRDITGGLPRVAELFEVRKPKDPAIITEIDGVVSFGETVRGHQLVRVTMESGESRDYLIPYGKHLRVHEGDRVQAGEKLCEGPVNPHDILRIKGPMKVQEHLLNEIQEVYRLQGVKINDKHIGVIVRQMLRKVRVKNPGDTDFLEDEQVDRSGFQTENERISKAGGQPAEWEPLLLGITKASLTTSSFISAASFQETTRVLTEHAIKGAKDDLLGLKENIIIGHLIPAGTGMMKYDEVTIKATGESEGNVSQPTHVPADEELESAPEVVL